MDFGGRRLYTLGYADDTTLLDGRIDVVTARVTDIVMGSRADADMTINIVKAEVIHACVQERVITTTVTEEVKVCVCKFKCKNAGCDWVFNNS